MDALLKISGNEKGDAVREFSKAVTAIFDSAFKNRIESAVVAEAIRGLAGSADQRVTVTNCVFNNGANDAVKMASDDDRGER